VGAGARVPLTTVTSLRPGQVLADRYEITRALARGGMADVVEAVDRTLGRRVALKVFRAGAGADRARFDAEALLLASLDHPGLVRIYDAGEHEGAAFVVLELIEGETLREGLAAGPLASERLAQLGAAVADALAYVHGRGVVHRDVTPANILVDATGTPRLADFGIARLVDTTRITAEATTLGTAAYMAPEQVQGRDVGPPADIYALGLVLLEAVSGRRAFDGPAHEAAVARLVRAPDTTAGVPAAWSPLLARMTERAVGDRPSAEEVRDALRALPEAPAARALGVLGGVGVSGLAGAEAAPAVTQALPVAPAVPAPDHGTSVMPVALAPSTDEPAPGGMAGGLAAVRTRPWLVAAVAALLVVAVVAAGNGGDGLDIADLRAETTTSLPAETTTTTTAPSTTTTVPPTTAAPAAPPATENGKGRGPGQKDKDDDDDDD
jgi:hypothetical protein